MAFFSMMLLGGLPLMREQARPYEPKPRFLLLLFVSLVPLTLVGPALAHERWADGRSVPEWVQRQCCGPADAHHLRPDQIHRTPDGYIIDGYRYHIPEPRLDPSPDGEWWLFYRTYPDGDQSPPFCFFGPDLGS